MDKGRKPMQKKSFSLDVWMVFDRFLWSNYYNQLKTLKLIYFFDDLNDSQMSPFNKPGYNSNIPIILNSIIERISATALQLYLIWGPAQLLRKVIEL